MNKRLKTNTHWDMYEEWFVEPYKTYMYLAIQHQLCSSALSALRPYWLSSLALHDFLISQMQICKWFPTPIPGMYVKAPFNCMIIYLENKHEDQPPVLKVELVNGSLTYKWNRRATVFHPQFGKEVISIVDLVKQLINFIS